MTGNALRWRIGHGAEAAFSSAEAGDQRRADRRRAWLGSLGLASCVVPRQVHGTRLVDADLAIDQAQDADGVVTAGAGPIGVFGADCPGLCLASEDALAVAHCGWRGTAAGMVARAIAALAAKTRSPRAQWCALIGPGISAAAYEVDAPVLDAREWPRSALSPRERGRALLDLAEAIACDLATAGITRVTRTGVCTFRDPRLHSYRGGGAKLAQLLVVWRGCLVSGGHPPDPHDLCRL
jgi:polyphenol oxidase